MLVFFRRSLQRCTEQKALYLKLLVCAIAFFLGRGNMDFVHWYISTRCQFNLELCSEAGIYTHCPLIYADCPFQKWQLCILRGWHVACLYINWKDLHSFFLETTGKGYSPSSRHLLLDILRSCLRFSYKLSALFSYLENPAFLDGHKLQNKYIKINMSKK